jgi:hypothetical protein
MTILCDPVATLSIVESANGWKGSASDELVYGGYANRRGEITLFGKELAYRLNFKNQMLREHPQLNEGARASYDAAVAGEPFEYGGVTFQRLSNERIIEICSAGTYRLRSRY